MKGQRKHSAKFKPKVVLESLRNQLTLSELARKYDLYPGLIQKWKTTFLSGASGIFESTSVKKSDNSKKIDRLYQQKGSSEYKAGEI